MESTSYRETIPAKYEDEVLAEVSPSSREISVGMPVTLVDWVDKPVVATHSPDTHNSFIGVCTRINPTGTVFISIQGRVPFYGNVVANEGEAVYLTPAGDITSNREDTFIHIGTWQNASDDKPLLLTGSINTVLANDYVVRDSALKADLDAILTAFGETITNVNSLINDLITQEDYNARNSALDTTLTSVNEVMEEHKTISTDYDPRITALETAQIGMLQASIAYNHNRDTLTASLSSSELPPNAEITIKVLNDGILMTRSVDNNGNLSLTISEGVSFQEGLIEVRFTAVDIYGKNISTTAETYAEIPQQLINQVGIVTGKLTIYDINKSAKINGILRGFDPAEGDKVRVEIFETTYPSGIISTHEATVTDTGIQVDDSNPDLGTQAIFMLDSLDMSTGSYPDKKAMLSFVDHRGKRIYGEAVTLYVNIDDEYYNAAGTLGDKGLAFGLGEVPPPMTSRIKIMETTVDPFAGTLTVVYDTFDVLDGTVELTVADRLAESVSSNVSNVGDSASHSVTIDISALAFGDLNIGITGQVLSGTRLSSSATDTYVNVDRGSIEVLDYDLYYVSNNGNNPNNPDHAYLECLVDLDLHDIKMKEGTNLRITITDQLNSPGSTNRLQHVVPEGHITNGKLTLKFVTWPDREFVWDDGSYNEDRYFYIQSNDISFNISFTDIDGLNHNTVFKKSFKDRRMVRITKFDVDWSNIDRDAERGPRIQIEGYINDFPAGSKAFMHFGNNAGNLGINGDGSVYTPTIQNDGTFSVDAVATLRRIEREEIWYNTRTTILQPIVTDHARGGTGIGAFFVTDIQNQAQSDLTFGSMSLSNQNKEISYSMTGTRLTVDTAQMIIIDSDGRRKYVDLTNTTTAFSGTVDVSDLAFGPLDVTIHCLGDDNLWHVFNRNYTFSVYNPPQPPSVGNFVLTPEVENGRLKLQTYKANMPNDFSLRVVWVAPDGSTSTNVYTDTDYSSVYYKSVNQNGTWRAEGTFTYNGEQTIKSDSTHYSDVKELISTYWTAHSSTVAMLISAINLPDGMRFNVTLKKNGNVIDTTIEGIANGTASAYFYGTFEHGLYEITFTGTHEGQMYTLSGSQLIGNQGVAIEGYQNVTGSNGFKVNVSYNDMLQGLPVEVTFQRSGGSTETVTGTTSSTSFASPQHIHYGSYTVTVRVTLQDGSQRTVQGNYNY